MFCVNCGSEMAEGQKFCANCGANVIKNVETENTVNMEIQQYGQDEMHCPRCGNTNLQVQMNNKILSSVSLGRSVGKRYAIGGTSYSSSQETYWFCSKCGTHFRDLDELESLIEQWGKKIQILSSLCVLLAVFLLVICTLVGVDNFIFALKGSIIAYVIFMIIFGVPCIWFCEHKKKIAQDEYDDLLPRVRPNNK